MERLSREHIAASQEQAHARSALRSVTAEPQDFPEPAALVVPDSEFAALISSADLSMEEPDDMDAVIRRAKEAAMNSQYNGPPAISTPVRPPRTLPSTPLGATKSAETDLQDKLLGQGQDSYVAGSATPIAAADPYLVSPGCSAAAASIMGHSVQRTRRSPALPGSTKDVTGRRDSVKGDAKPAQPVQFLLIQADPCPTSLLQAGRKRLR